MFGNGATPRATARRFESCVRSAVTRRAYSATAPSIEAESQEPALSWLTRADVDGEDRAACSFDAADDLGLNGERANEPVEVRDDDDVGLPRFDHLDRAAQSVALLERGAAGHVQFFDRVDELEPVALASGPDTLGLLGRITNCSPSRSPTRETRTTPMARLREDALVEEGKPHRTSSWSAIQVRRSL